MKQFDVVTTMKYSLFYVQFFSHLERDWRDHAYGGGLRVPGLHVRRNEEVRQEERSTDARGPEYPSNNANNLCPDSGHCLLGI